MAEPLPGDLDRRKFLVRFCQGAGAILIPATLWGQDFPWLRCSAGFDIVGNSGYQLHPHYRSQRPVDDTLLKVEPGLDQFSGEKYADQIGSILRVWGAQLRRRVDVQVIAESLADDFSGVSLQPTESRLVRSGAGLQVRENKFSNDAALNRSAFLRELRDVFTPYSKIVAAEFQITNIAVTTGSDSEGASRVTTRVRYEIVAVGADFHREQKVGHCNLSWIPSSTRNFRVRSWRPLEETQARANSPVFADVTATALGANLSYEAQILHGVDYWRTILDGACGIDIYGHNGVSAADIDNDGFDEIYVCQPAGLPNRLYRNRADGTFEDITDASGLGILENTACALFADFNNDGRQDVILVRANGPVLFVNEGGAKFREKPNAFAFAHPPQGTFTGAAVADYDRDGWLDIYFCLYAYYQGTGQYRYPSPYHDAENGPPNFLMRNQRDGTFRDVTAECGLNQNNTRYSFCCGWNDFDRDGWPDLYVVNDFGRKNLYRNNGNGTFTDVAEQTGVEDVGAGMSVCWFDHDNDGADDLYVANMWTAAGVRISTQEIFKKDSSPEIRALYQKHAMGNSLFRNHGTAFDNVTNSSGARVGRWSWSSDAFDFDHDGFLDLYVANGMVSGPRREGIPETDLNSFFWRQVVANSPDEARAAPDYEAGWNAINELIRSDGTWSGFERNVFYGNNHDGTFSNLSAVVDLDFSEDGRSFAVADLDHDGRLEIILKNRNGPQVRILKNAIPDLPPSIAFRLTGKKSNRDAIGAVITLETGSGHQTRTVQAGSGFLSQHSKEIFFGLGDAKGGVRATIRWPSGLVQEFHDLPLNHRIWIEEGSEPSRREEFQKPSPPSTIPVNAEYQPEFLPTTVETWLLEPFPAPDFAFNDAGGRNRVLSSLRGKPVLLNLWSPQSEGEVHDLETLAKFHARWAATGLQVMSVNIADDAGYPDMSFVLEQKVGFPPALRGSADVAAIYNILYRQLFDRHRDLTLPTSFLIDAKGNIVKVYQGPINPEHVEHDFSRIPQDPAARLTLALPFPSTKHTLEFGRNYLSYGSMFFQRGYLDQAEVAFQLALRDDPSSAEALYGIGSVYLNQNKNSDARQTFERAVKLQANYPGTLPDSWNNLGVIATREGRYDDSIACFQQALKLDPHHLLSLDNLGNAYRVQKRWDEARKVLERALAVAPQDAEANYSLGMVYAQTDDNAKAYEYLQRALKARPVYPEALNNLGVLYVVTERRNEAVASFQQCIRVAPAFDQAYLNLARVYALEGARDRARGVLNDLLQQHPGHPQAEQMLEQLQP